MSGGYALYGLLALMALGWSGNYIVGKIALRELPPLLLAGLRVSLAGVFMLPVYCWQWSRTRDRLKPGELPELLVLGVLGAALNQVLFVVGLSRTSAAHSAIFANLSPLVVLLFAAWQGIERLTSRKLAGMALALGGVALLQLAEHPARGGSGSGPTWIGDLLTFCGCCAFALYTVLGKPATRRHSAITVNTVTYVGGGLAIAPVVAWQAAGFSFGQVSVAAWASLLYMALFSSVVCYLIFFHALSHMAPSRVSGFLYFQPPMAAVLGIVVLGEPISLPLVIAMLVILAGVYLAERQR